MLSIAALALSTFAAVAVPSLSPPQHKLPPVVLTSLTMGETDPNAKVPTVNGVPDAGTLNWDVAMPVAAMIVGRRYTVTATFHDFAYDGACNTQVTMSRKLRHKQVVLRQTALGPGTCASGKVFLMAGDFGIAPDAPGPVTLSIVLHFGDATATTKVPMTIVEP
ncbi:MAG TPA: hypothetical protein VG889_02635 [Rhizomicrobium sp.]|nr:hypothetical protein [Rhizomicrobium sp.]